jgi:hypothetical protein
VKAQVGQTPASDTKHEQTPFVIVATAAKKPHTVGPLDITEHQIQPEHPGVKNVKTT